MIERVGVGPGNEAGESTGLSGNGFVGFYNTAANNLTAYAATLSDSNAVKSGAFVPQAGGGAASDITAPFVNTPANGTWRLRFVDYRATNTGTVLQASLRIGTIARSATTACANAKNALAAAKAVDKKASAIYSKAKAKFEKAKRSGSPKAKKAKKAMKAARAVDKTAAAQLAAAMTTKTASC